MCLLDMVRLCGFVLAAVTAFEGIHEGDNVPVFQLKTSEGQAFSSAEGLKGSASIVTFCRIDQEYSEQLLKDLQQVQAELKGQGLRVAAICSGEADPAKVQALTKRLNLEFAVLLDPDRSVYGKFGVIVAPATGFVDGKGVLRFYYAGYRRDFLETARANAGFLLGKVTAGERDERTKPKETVAPKSSPAGTHYRLGLQLLKQGDRKGALDEFNKAWENQPRMAEAGVELGLLLLVEDKNEEALKVLSEAATLAPNDPRATGAKGVALLRSGKQDEGKELVEKAVAQNPVEPLLYYEIGLWSEQHGDTAAAARYFKQGLEMVLNRQRRP